MDNLNDYKVLIPLIRKTFPEIIAEDIIGVQPMTDLPKEYHKDYVSRVHVCDDSCDTGSWVHVFGQGWQMQDCCPLNKGNPNIVFGNRITYNSSIFGGMFTEDAGLHLLCQINNLTYR